jgi:C4-type Zn-finger protein
MAQVFVKVATRLDVIIREDGLVVRAETGTFQIPELSIGMSVEKAAQGSAKLSVLHSEDEIARDG